MAWFSKTRILALALTVSIVAALWVTRDSSLFIGHVISEDTTPLSFLMDFGEYQVDTRNASMAVNGTASILNLDGLLNVSLTFDIVRVDAQDTCTDYETDCVVRAWLSSPESFGYGATYSFSEAELVAGQVVELAPGESLLKTELSCQRFSCAQTVRINATVVSV